MVPEWKLANIPGGQQVTLIAQTLRATSVSNEASTSDTHPVGWQKPAPSRLKCNVDAAFSSSQNRT